MFSHPVHQSGERDSRLLISLPHLDGSNLFQRSLITHIPHYLSLHDLLRLLPPSSSRAIIVRVSRIPRLSELEARSPTEQTYELLVFTITICITYRLCYKKIGLKKMK